MRLGFVGAQSSVQNIYIESLILWRNALVFGVLIMSSSLAVSTVDNAVGLDMKKSTVMLLSNSAYFDQLKVVDLGSTVDAARMEW